jgi:hypothetical protein
MLTPGRYYPNSTIRLQIVFSDDDGSMIDPTTVKLRTFDPDGLRRDYTYGTDIDLLRADTGIYYADITPDKSGQWYARWETSGNYTFAKEHRFNINYSPWFDPVAKDYV